MVEVEVSAGSCIAVEMREDHCECQVTGAVMEIKAGACGGCEF